MERPTGPRELTSLGRTSKENGEAIAQRYNAELSTVGSIIVIALGVAFGSFFTEAGKDAYEFVKRLLNAARAREREADLDGKVNAFRMSIAGKQTVRLTGFIEKTPVVVEIRYWRERELETAIRTLPTGLRKITALLKRGSHSVSGVTIVFDATRPAGAAALPWSVKADVRGKPDERLLAELLSAFSVSRPREFDSIAGPTDTNERPPLHRAVDAAQAATRAREYAINQAYLRESGITLNLDEEDSENH